MSLSQGKDQPRLHAHRGEARSNLSLKRPRHGAEKPRYLRLILGKNSDFTTDTHAIVTTPILIQLKASSATVPADLSKPETVGTDPILLHSPPIP
jgi:hypothetical protein